MLEIIEVVVVSEGKVEVNGKVVVVNEEGEVVVEVVVVNVNEMEVEC